MSRSQVTTLVFLTGIKWVFQDPGYLYLKESELRVHFHGPGSGVPQIFQY